MAIWRDKIETLSAIWKNRFPLVHPRQHTLIEKLVCTIAIVICLGSLANFKDAFRKKNCTPHLFMDLYVIVWAGLLSIMLFCSWVSPWFAILIAAYRVVDIVSYRIFFLLVKSQEKPWTAEILRRSVVIAAVNFYEVVMAFAVLYRATGSVIQNASSPAPLNSPGTAFYYSLVTMVTVGYGDYIPANSMGRGLVIAQLTTMILFLIFLLPALVSVFSPDLTRRRDNAENAD